MIMRARLAGPMLLVGVIAIAAIAAAGVVALATIPNGDTINACYTKSGASVVSA